MIELVTGGSGSGKSEYAESRAVSIHRKYGGRLIYIATMMAYDDEAVQKIERHRMMRAGKGFETIECFTGLSEAALPDKSVVLIDCLSNLAANEMFLENGSGMDCVRNIEMGLRRIGKACAGVVMVTNEIFSDGIKYAPETQKYIHNLAIINRIAADMSDTVSEVVCGIPIIIKGDMKNA